VITDEWFAVFMVLLIIAFALAVGLGIAAIERHRTVLDTVCKRAGYDSREILGDGHAYCVDYWTDYRIVPFETVVVEVGE